MMLFSCHNAEQWNGIEFNHQGEKLKIKAAEVKDVEENSIFSDEEMVFDVSVDMDFMDYSKGEGDSLACATINNYIITQLLGQPEGTGQKEAVDGYIAQSKADFKTDEYMLTLHDHLTGKAEYGPEGVINYTFTEDFYGGGAHPTLNVIIKRFSTADGKEIGLWDVFVDSCSEHIKTMLTQRLMKQQGAESMEELQEQGYLEMVDMFIPQNFYIKKDSITFFFNQYDIAPYACGQTSLSFSYEEMKKFMR